MATKLDAIVQRIQNANARRDARFAARSALERKDRRQTYADGQRLAESILRNVEILHQSGQLQRWASTIRAALAKTNTPP